MKMGKTENYLFLKLLELVGHDAWLVVDCKDDFSDTCISKSFNLVAKDRFVGKVNEGFGN